MPAKYTLLSQPTIQRMLHEERIAALEKAVALIDVQLMRGDQGERRDYFLAKRREAETMLNRARRAQERRQALTEPTSKAEGSPSP